MNSCLWHGSLSKGTKAKCSYQFRYRRTDCTDNCLPSLISFLSVYGRESMPVWPALQWYIVITTHSQLWLLQGTLEKLHDHERNIVYQNTYKKADLYLNRWYIYLLSCSSYSKFMVSLQAYFPFVQSGDVQLPALEHSLCLLPDGLPLCKLGIVIQDLVSS